MANIRKSFNFRNGVQVDEDNFIVNSNGLVGIGTSIPSQSLDVRGTAKVVGLVTASDVFVSGVATITEIQVGSAITISSGVITATAFKGDGSTLSNLPTSQWIDVNQPGLGFTSIYAAGNVGIATTEPLQSFQVGGSPDVVGKSGVGINSIGNIKATGIVTATSFVGALTGDVTGDVTGDLTGAVTGNLTGNVTGNVDGDINSTGISTFATLSVTGLVNVGTAATFNDAGLDVTGVTSSTSFVGALTGDVTGNVTGNLTGNVVGDINSGITTAATELNVGTGGTSLTSLNTGKLGIGTAIPSKDVTIKKEADTSVEIVSESGVSNISIGLTGETKNKGIIRFNNDANTFDIVNNDTGDINFILDASSNSGTGDIRFIKTTSEKMRLTNDGKLGIAITNPSHQLHVVGTSTVTGNTFIGGNLSIGGTFSGRLALGQTLEANIFTTSGVSTFNNVNFVGPIGFNSATPNADVDFQQATATFGSVGLGTTNPTGKLKVVGEAFFDTIGINTTFIQTDQNFSVGGFQIAGDQIHLFDSQIRFDFARTSQIGVGTFGDTLSGVVDLSRAGNSFSPWVFIPQMSTTTRNTKTTATGQNSTGIGTGAIIYNTTTERIEIYLPDGDSSANVTNWVGIATVN